jgi:hypothetical protein
LPPQSYLYRIVREDSLFVVVTLIQSNTVTAFDIYRRYYVYLSSPHKLSITAIYLF